MRIAVFIICLLLSENLLAQQTFPVKITDFSPQYEASIDLNKKDTLIKGMFENYNPEYVIKVWNKRSKKVVLTAYSSYYPDYLMNQNNEAIANVKELPYGSQSVLIYEDFNFDKIPDLAIMNGNNSCYSGPSFDIYLAQASRFVYSEGFSDLSNNYCGMFQVDADTKEIHTMSKGGCCYHEYSTFKVVNNKPVLVKLISEGISYEPPRFTELTIKETKNGRTTSKVSLMLPYEIEEDSTSMLSFTLEKNAKKIVLFPSDSILYYTLLKPDDFIEFSYPKPKWTEASQDYIYDHFTYDGASGTLRFKNKETEYIIYETGNSIGVKVTTKGNSYDLKGVYTSKKGSLKQFVHAQLKNLL
ncbi:MAG: hypothetical protein QM640_11565 [Niabella sp.]